MRPKAPVSKTVVLLLVLAALAGTGWAVIAVTDLRRGDGEPTLDERLLLAMRVPGDANDPLGPHWFEAMARDVTALGSIAVLAMTTLGVAGYLLLNRQRRTALAIAVTVGSGALVSFALKAAIRRPRPSLVPSVVSAYTTSFPSGHAMMSAVTYLTLAALLAPKAPRRTKAYLLLLATYLAVLVGASRVYLGVHWPTDVLAGWAAGALWTLAGRRLARRLRAPRVR
jgi:undecaprenyl-diphosphatase